MKMKTTKKKKVVPYAVPVELRARRIAKFKSKDRSRRYLVARMSNDMGTEVYQVLRQGPPSLVRSFLKPPATDSGIPTPVLSNVARELAIFWTRHMARKGTVLGAAQEVRRRRKLMREALKTYKAHQAIKQTVTLLKNPIRSVVKKPRPQILMPWVVLYDPKQSCGDTTFRVHASYCTRLDRERQKAVLKKDGASWIVEAPHAADAVALQVKEFAETDMGYEPIDFAIHECGRPPAPRVTGKTVMGHVARTRKV